MWLVNGVCEEEWEQELRQGTCWYENKRGYYICCLMFRDPMVADGYECRWTLWAPPQPRLIGGMLISLPTRVCIAPSSPPERHSDVSPPPERHSSYPPEDGWKRGEYGN